MDKIKVTGGTPLKGQIRVSGSKNTALAIMPVCLLTDQPVELSNIPNVSDVHTLNTLFQQHGVDASFKEGVVHLQASEITNTTAPYDIVSKMRASFWVLGPLLARMGEAKVSLPGGDAIGARPVNFHLKGLEVLGADIELESGYVIAKAPNGLTGGRITMPHVSVGATITLLMAATLAKGETVIVNAAREPDVCDLGECLIKMGAKIEGLGTNIIRIQGVESLSSVSHRIIPDRIEAGSYAVAAAISGGDVELLDADCTHIETFLNFLRATGTAVDKSSDRIRITAPDGRLQPVDITTEAYPGYPTDLQAQMVALMTLAEGTSTITEGIFENRFMHVPELRRMGAKIDVQGKSAIIHGVDELVGAEVMSTDLRASVCLISAGLKAKGDTVVSRVYHLDRGFENLEEKLKACGAQIERLKS